MLAEFLQNQDGHHTIGHEGLFYLIVSGMTLTVALVGSVLATVIPLQQQASAFEIKGL